MVLRQQASELGNGVERLTQVVRGNMDKLLQRQMGGLELGPALNQAALVVMQIGHRSGQQQGRHQGCGKGQGDEAGLPVGRSGRRHKNTAGQPQGHRHRDQCGQQHHRHHFQQHRGGQQGQGEVDKRIRHEAQAQQAAQHRQRRQQPQPPVAQGLAQPLRVLIGQQQRGGQHRQGAEYRALVPGQRQRDHLLPPEHAKTERSQPGGQRLRQHTAQQQQAQQGSWRVQGRVG